MESMIETMVFISDGEDGRGGNLTYVAELCAGPPNFPFLHTPHPSA